MRISTSSIFDTNVSAMNQQQADMLHTQLQVSSGKRIMTPADDPAGAAQVIDLTQTSGMNTQYTTNRNAANTSLTLTESTLQSVTTLIQNMQTTAVSAGNAALSNSDRQTMATTLQGDLNQLIGLANSTDANGNYLFSGSQGNVKPFVTTASGVQYQGDTGQRLIQVASNLNMVSNANGAELFMENKNGNGSFVTSASSSNSGSGIISQGNVTSPPPTTLQQGNTYTVTFTVGTGGATTYTITGTDASGAALPTAAQTATLPANQSYTSGQTISFNGIEFSIQGTPASGDTFTVQPSTNVSVFQTVQNLINTLNTAQPPGNTTASATYSQQLDQAMGNLNQSLNSVLTVRARVGSNLSQITSLQSTGDTLNLQYQSAISQLQDLDYTKAVSQLTQQQIGLQAAMQSFKIVSGLSLFNYL
ncbi:MAG: flagellar hook-associated protein FlgL [Betaproteobacteria bacterium]|nr:flagellar hook-associated protein FlgL [Betaproteobacteria bacterium]